MAELTFEEFLRGLGPGVSPDNIFARLMEQMLQQAEPTLAEAFVTCAVPHRFDAPLLAALRDGTEEEAADLVKRMSALSFVYQSPDGKYYYHEDARALLLARAREDAARFRDWSARAADFYQKRLQEQAEKGEPTPEVQEWSLEFLYHWLAVDDAAAFALFEQIFRQAEFAWQLSLCSVLVEGVREQAAALTGDRALWLRYYEGRLLNAAQRWAEAAAVQREVLAQNPEKKLRAWTLQELGNSLQATGQWEEAIECYKRDVEISRDLGDRAGEASTLGNIGNVYQRQGRWNEALAQYEACLAIERDLGDRAGEASTLGNIGNVYQRQGRWNEALAQYEASLKLKRELGDRAGEAATLNNIGNVYDSQGRWNDALAQYEASLKMQRDLGDRAGEAQTLNALAITSRKQGQWDKAVEFYQQSLAIDRELGDVDGESTALNNLGVVLAKRGAWQDAIANYEASLAIARRLGSRIEEARTLGNLGDLFKETIEWGKAREHYEQAILILRGTEDKEQLADWLEELAELHRMQHKWEDALRCEEEALGIWRQRIESE